MPQKARISRLADLRQVWSAAHTCEPRLGQATLRVLASVIKEPCFRELRTKQQVGYSVSASHDVSVVHCHGGEAPLRVEGLVVCATSKSLSAADVLRRIDDFLAAFRAGTLASLDEHTVHSASTRPPPTAYCAAVHLLYGHVCVCGGACHCLLRRGPLPTCAREGSRVLWPTRPP